MGWKVQSGRLQLSMSLVCLVCGCGHPQGPAQINLWPFDFCRQPHLITLAHSPSLASYTISMAKESKLTRNNARYEPYNSSRRPDRRRGSPPPNNWGNQDRSNSSIYRFLDDLNKRYGGHDLSQLFHKHAGQSGALGEAINMWLLFDNVSALLTSISSLLFQTDTGLANR